MHFSNEELSTTPVLGKHNPLTQSVEQWSSVMGSIFGVFLHLSLLGINFMYWWINQDEPMRTGQETMQTLSILWSTGWAFAISSLAIFFLWSLSKLISSLCPMVAHEVLYGIESGFVIGCLCSLLMMELFYSASQLITSSQNGNFLLFALVCCIGIGATVRIKLFTRQDHNDADQINLLPAISA